MYAGLKGSVRAAMRESFSITSIKRTISPTLFSVQQRFGERRIEVKG